MEVESRQGTTTFRVILASRARRGVTSVSEGRQKYSCPKCRQDYPIEQTRWRCDCGSFLDLNVNVEFPILKIMDRPPNLWRYRETLPILKDDHIVTLGEGFTPLEELVLDGRSVHVKIDYLFPTGSYKDRGATVLISKARELGAQKIVERFLRQRRIRDGCLLRKGQDPL